MGLSSTRLTLPWNEELDNHAIINHEISPDEDEWTKYDSKEWSASDKCPGCVARFIRCSDGDTCQTSEIWARDRSNGMLVNLPPLLVASVRIGGVDAPEIKGACELERCLAQHARQKLDEFVLDSSSSRLRRIVGCKHDKYFRYLCDIVDDGTPSIRASTSMVKAGLAVPWNGRGGRPLNWCDAGLVRKRAPAAVPFVDECQR